jgi:hypothetical protein
MELIYEILKKDGYTDADIAILRANVAEKQADFTVDDFVNRVSERRNDLFIATKKADIIETYENEHREANFLKTIVPVQNALIKAANLTKEDAAGKDWRALLDILAKKQQTAIEEASTTNDKEMLVKYGQLQKEYQELQDTFKNEVSAWNEKVTNTEKSAEKKIKTFVQRDALTKLATDKTKVDWDDEKKMQTLYIPGAIDHILGNYFMDDNGQIWGDPEFKTKAVWSDRKTMIENPTHALNLWAEEKNALRKSNGGNESEVKLQPDQIEMKGKVISNVGAKALEDFFTNGK